MTVDITIHDKKSGLWQKGVGSGPLRQKSRTIYEKICHQENINYSEVEGRIEFKFTRCHRNPWDNPTIALGYLRVELVQNNKHTST